MELITEIKKFVNEELGLSELVKDTSKNLIAEIIKDSRKHKSLDVADGGFSYTLFGKRVNILYHMYRVKDDETLGSLKIDNPGAYYENSNVLETTIVYVKEKNAYIDYAGTTRHEIKHVYQSIKKQKPLLFGKSQDTYQKARTLRKSGDFFEQIVGYTIYYANNFERDAFVSTWYSLIDNSPAKDPYEVIQTTSVYKNIKIIHNFLDNLTISARQVIENICQNNFGRHFKWWKNIALRVCSDYVNRIGKIIAKAEKERNQDGALRDPSAVIKPYERFVDDDNENNK